MNRTWFSFALILIILSSTLVAAIFFDFIPIRTSGPINETGPLAERPAGLLEPRAISKAEDVRDPDLPPGIQVKFVDVTEKSGIHFVHFYGHTEMEYIMETTGSGIGWLDYDQDGLMDLFIVQGGAFPVSGGLRFAPVSPSDSRQPGKSPLTTH